jgi:hypothetical protein
MGVRTRGLDIATNAKRQVADAVARAEAKGVVERWNEQLASGPDMLWSPTIPAALRTATLGRWPPFAALASRGRDCVVGLAGLKLTTMRL